MALTNGRFFHYRTGSSFLHKTPPALKIILMLSLAVAAFYVPVIPSAALWLTLILLSLTLLHFPLNEVLSDLAPSITYALMIFLVSIMLNLVSAFSTGFFSSEEIVSAALPQKIFLSAAYIFKISDSYAAIIVHLALSLEISSVFFRTTSVMEFSAGFRSIEQFFTRRNETPLADTLSLTLTFIPQLSIFWSRIETAWKSRGGKDGLTKIRKLVPVLFRVSMQEGSSKAMARAARM